MQAGRTVASQASPVIRTALDLIPDDKVTALLVGALLGASLFLVHAWRLYLRYKRERNWADPRRRDVDD